MRMNLRPFTSPISYRVWDTRYRWREHGQVRETAVADTWRRVAGALAAVEPEDRARWEERFVHALEGFRFLPGGRILAGAGIARRVTLFNCFVMGRLDDSIGGIFDALKEGALTMQQGGGIGLDFSTLRPRGDCADETGGIASGPVSFMRVWDGMCSTLLATNARRGAMMATLSCEHPDIEEFIDAKSQPEELRHFNLSVLVTEAFLQAMKADAAWPLAFPCAAGTAAATDAPAARNRRVYRRVGARALWARMVRANYAYAEPGVLFIDRVNALNNLAYAEDLRATNPCGEIPLPAYGACNLGSLNLTQFVQEPFTPRAVVDWVGLRDTAAIAARMLDNVYEVSHFPLPQQREVARRSRRLGIGITGLADALIMLGLRYGDPPSLELAREIMRAIGCSAYRASIQMARERGSFPAFECAPYLQAPFIQHFPDDIRAGIREHGIRNSHLLAIAPTGSISLFANNVSSGLEPVFAAEYGRIVRQPGESAAVEQITDYAVNRFRAAGVGAGLPPAFVAGADVDPEAQLAMQAALQEQVDNAISKTVSVPEQFDFVRFGRLFETAHALGLKGCTTFRPNPVRGAVLVRDADVDSCCAMRSEHR